MEERKKAIQNLKIAKGQIEGIIKMMEDERYCVDISNQIIAVQSLLKKANMQILRRHLDHCVKDAILHNNGDEKINEIIQQAKEEGAYQDDFGAFEQEIYDQGFRNAIYFMLWNPSERSCSNCEYRYSRELCGEDYCGQKY